MGEQEFVDYLADNGWDVEWVSILEEDASYGNVSQAEAASFASEYGLDPASVLFDATKEWASQAVPSGYPTIYSVHTTNMLIWDRSDGWNTPGTAAWDEMLAWFDGFFNYCITQDPE